MNTITNEHLRPVFEIILPALELVGIPYWVYGGIAIAGIAGEFVRPSQDVDLFVLSGDYKSSITLIEGFEERLGWYSKDREPLKGVRPVREWFVMHGSSHDILSVIPVFEIGSEVQFIYEKNLIPKTQLTQERRTVNSYTFITPSFKFIKELFMHKMNSHLTKDRIKRSRKDAAVLLDDDELAALLAKFDRIERERGYARV